MYVDEVSVDEEFANRIDSRFVPGVGAQDLTHLVCSESAVESCSLIP